MKTNKPPGIFFILATVLAIIGLKLSHPILTNQASLIQGTADSIRIVSGAVVEWMLIGTACRMALLLYSYWRLFKERLGLSYFCFLVLEVLFNLGLNTLIYGYIFFQSELVSRKRSFSGCTGVGFNFMVS